MSYKSTQTLKRSEALDTYTRLLEEVCGIQALTNDELASLIEHLEDIKAERENTTNFNNYNVLDDYVYESIQRDKGRY